MDKQDNNLETTLELFFGNYANKTNTYIDDNIAEFLDE